MELKREDLESVRCDFCGADDCSRRYEKRGFRIVRCRKCGLVYVNPRLKQEKIAALYNADYFRGNGFDTSIDYVKDANDHAAGKDTFTLDDWDCDTILALLKKSRPPAPAPYTLLEVGCGTGVFLDKARMHGFDCRGLELSEYAASFARQRGIPVETKSIDTSLYPPDSFDAVIMREVIEHLPHVMSSLTTVFSWLKQGGVLFMATGNYDCPERRLRGGEWSYFMPEGHLTVFSNRTMRNYLRKVGFGRVMVTNQGDALMEFLRGKNIISRGEARPRNILKRIAFLGVRCVNHFISSGMRIYAVK